jgi:hypothetical protein
MNPFNQQFKELIESSAQVKTLAENYSKTFAAHLAKRPPAPF